MSKGTQGLLNASAQQEEVPSLEQLKGASQETYGLKLPNQTTYWVPLYNERNRYATWEDLVEIFSKLYDDVNLERDGSMSYTIMSPDAVKIIIKRDTLKVFQQAWIHQSYSDGRKLFKTAKDWISPDGKHDANILPIQNCSYEAIEWHGDSAVQGAISNYLAWRYPVTNKMGGSEGFLTKARSKLVRTSSLGAYANWLGFSKLLIMSKYQDEYLNGREDYHILEDSFEAFIGCLSQVTYAKYQSLVYTDFLIRIMELLIDIPVFLSNDENYKDLLMQYYHKTHNGAFPTYSEQGIEELNGLRLTKMAVHDPWGAVLVTATGTTKKEAEQKAAKMACQHYNIELYDGGNPFHLEATCK
jgi:ribonuclease-3